MKNLVRISIAIALIIAGGITGLLHFTSKDYKHQDFNTIAKTLEKKYGANELDDYDPITGDPSAYEPLPQFSVNMQDLEVAQEIGLVGKEDPFSTIYFTVEDAKDYIDRYAKEMGLSLTDEEKEYLIESKRQEIMANKDKENEVIGQALKDRLTEINLNLTDLGKEIIDPVTIVEDFDEFIGN